MSTHLGAGAGTAAESVGLSPATDRQFQFVTAGSLLTDASVESLAATADAVAVWALTDTATATGVFGCDARTVTGTPAEQCFERFLQTKGQRLLRRRLSAAEVDDTLAWFRTQAAAGQSDGTREGFRQGLASLLLHPDFLFVRDAPDGQSQRLDAFSLASRLSFALTGHGPDDELFAAAADGSLLDETAREVQVSRLLATPEARERTRAFYRQWLRYDGWSVAYSAAFLEGVDASQLEREATTELDGFFERLTWQENAGASALLTSRFTPPLSPTLARVYGATEGVTELPEARGGLLTRAGLLASGTDNWHVVARGLTVAQKLLCRDIPPPAVNVADAIRQAESLRVSNAERIKAVTSSGNCMGCHQTINPLGAARSDFDALGRAVNVEKHFAGGQFDFEVPAVSSAELLPVFGRPTPVEGTVSLSSVVAESPDFERCFAQQFARSAMGRADDSDECLTFDGAQALGEGGSMLDAMSAIVRSPDFLLWRE